MKNQMNFVITEDKDTANELMKAGFQIVQTSESSWLFLNDNNKLLFACESKVPLKFAYTNKMMF